MQGRWQPWALITVAAMPAPVHRDHMVRSLWIIKASRPSHEQMQWSHVSIKLYLSV